MPPSSMSILVLVPLGDALDRAPTGADHRADQLGIDAEAEQAAGMRREDLTGLLDCLQHLLEDVQPGRAGPG